MKERAIDLVISYSVEPVENCIIDFPVVIAIKLDCFLNTSGPFIQYVTKLKDDQWPDAPEIEVLMIVPMSTTSGFSTDPQNVSWSSVDILDHLLK